MTAEKHKMLTAALKYEASSHAALVIQCLYTSIYIAMCTVYMYVCISVTVNSEH